MRCPASDDGDMWALSLAGFSIFTVGAIFENTYGGFSLHRFFSVSLTAFDIFRKLTPLDQCLKCIFFLDEIISVMVMSPMKTIVF